jgi:polyisoprenoid-binding protein YceI
MALFSRKSSTDSTSTTAPVSSTSAPAAVAVLDAGPFDAATQAVGDVTGTYDLDPTHTRIGFSARHAMVTTVRGSFTEFTGEARIDTVNPEASAVSLTIQAASVNTGQEQRDGHLRTGDFFEAEKYPTMEFRSTGIKSHAGAEFVLDGELTIKDVTKPVELTVEFDGAAVNGYGKALFAFTATTEIDREDWGLTWNMALESGGVMVGKKVKIEIEGEAIRQD